MQRMLRDIKEQPEEIPQPAPQRIFLERQRITGLPLYFQGYLSVRHSRCQEFRVYWTELRGTVLFFYDDKKAPTANDCECGKEWKGFILTLTKMSVPLDESLQPGQLTRMHEVLEKEKKRRLTVNSGSSTSLNRKSPPSSTLTTMPVAPRLKHYKVMSKGTSYIIELERQVMLPSLQDVVNYFVTQTRGNLKPFVLQTHTAEDPAFRKQAVC